MPVNTSSLPALLALTLLIAFPAEESLAEPELPEGVNLLGETRHLPINEMSGIVKSRRFDGVYWVHNDSGDEPRLFAVQRDGKVIMPGFLDSFHTEEPKRGKTPFPGLPVRVSANVDWEDIAIDDDRIYIADVGNNGNARRDMGVYVLMEPNPTAVEATRTLKHMPVRYEDQETYPAQAWHFDSEAMFMADSHLYFVTKHRQAGKISNWAAGANLYRLETVNTDSINILKRADENPEVSMVTGADLSPDGSKLALVTYTGVWVFGRPATDDKWLSSDDARFLPLNPEVTQQLEAICWEDDQTLLITNEQRQIFEVRLSAIPAI